MSDLRWRIYYADHRPYDNSMGDPTSAPRVGVQAIVQIDPNHGRHIVPPGDYYYFHHDRWWSGDEGGMINHLESIGVLDFDPIDKMPVYLGGKMDGLRVIMSATSAGYILRGSWIDRDEFDRIFGIANSDPDFPRRTAYYREEVIAHG